MPTEPDLRPPPEGHPDIRVGLDIDPRASRTPDGRTTRFDCVAGCLRPLYHYGVCITRVDP